MSNNEPKPTEPYEADDRGDRVQFYETKEFERVAELNREAEVNGVCDQKTWDGGPDVTEWAKANGYAEEIAEATQI